MLSSCQYLEMLATIQEELKQILTGGETVFAPPTGFRHLLNAIWNPPGPPPPPDFNIVVNQPLPDKLYVRTPGWCKNCFTAPGFSKGVEETILRLGGRGLINGTRLRLLDTQNIGGAKTVAPPVALQLCCVQPKGD